MLQVFINSIISGLLLALVVLGFNIIFTATHIFHLAHGAVYILGVYAYYFLSANNHLPFYLSVLLSLLLVANDGYLVELIAYRPLMYKAGKAELKNSFHRIL